MYVKNDWCFFLGFSCEKKPLEKSKKDYENYESKEKKSNFHAAHFVSRLFSFGL